jgi:hypothetical protein
VISLQPEDLILSNLAPTVIDLEIDLETDLETKEL